MAEMVEEHPTAVAVAEVAEFRRNQNMSKPPPVAQEELTEVAAEAEAALVVSELIMD